MSARRWWVVPAACLAVSLAAFFLGLSWRLEVSGAAPLRLSPLAERRLIALALVPLLSPAVGLVVVALRRAFSLRVALALGALVLLGGAGGAALMTVLKDDWIFGDRYLHSERSPDGAAEAHFYRGGFLGCDHVLYVGPPRAHTVTFVSRQAIACDAPGQPGAAWLADGGVALTTDGGTPVPFSLFPAWN